MKIKRPGKKTIVFVAALAAMGGGGFGAVKYFGFDPHQLMALLPLDAAKHYLAMLGLADEKGLRPTVMDGEEQHAAEAQASHDAGHEAENAAEPGHSAESGEEKDAGGEAAGEHAQEPDKAEGKDEAHGESAGPEIPYVAPATLQSPLVRQVRSLQSVQERLAQGDKKAAKEQRELLIQLGDSVSKLPVERATLGEIYSSVTYLLSGGRPDVVDRFSQRKDLPHATQQLLAGAIAYVKGETATASDQLRDLDPLRFGPSIAGHLAMVQASAVEDLAPSRRRELLELTANTMLGTLLEEAALRRLMELASEHHDVGVFLRSAQRYSRRFSNSLYNAEYRGALLHGIMKLEAAKQGLSAAQLDSLIFQKSAERRNDILGSLAVASLRGGLSELCRYASARQRRLSPEGSAPWTRASLYHASCSVTGGDAGAMERLKGLNGELLDREDQELLKSALLLAEHAALADKPVEAAAAQLPDKETLTEELVAFREKVRGNLARIGEVVEGSSQ